MSAPGGVRWQSWHDVAASDSGDGTVVESDPGHLMSQPVPENLPGRPDGSRHPVGLAVVDTLGGNWFDNGGRERTPGPDGFVLDRMLSMQVVQCSSAVTVTYTYTALSKHNCVHDFVICINVYIYILCHTHIFQISYIPLAVSIS